MDEIFFLFGCSAGSALRKIKMAMISTLTPTPIPIHPSSGQQGWKTLPLLIHQILLTPANQGLQQTSSPDLDAVKARMHVQHKLGPKLKKAANRQSTHKVLHKIQNTKNLSSRKALSGKT